MKIYNNSNNLSTNPFRLSLLNIQNMLAGECERNNKDHVKTCKPCINFHQNLNNIFLLPLILITDKETKPIQCIISAIEAMTLVRSLRLNIITDLRLKSQKNFEFLDSLSSFFLNLSSTVRKKSYNMSSCLNFLLSEYSSYIIEDIFDGFSIIFHHIHNSLQDCNPICPIHKSLKLSIFETFSCQCKAFD